MVQVYAVAIQRHVTSSEHLAHQPWQMPTFPDATGALQGSIGIGKVAYEPHRMSKGSECRYNKGIRLIAVGLVGGFVWSRPPYIRTWAR